MSTTGGSEQGTVYVLDEPSAIDRRSRARHRDFMQRVPDLPHQKPGITNLIEILGRPYAAPSPPASRGGLRRARLREFTQGAVAEVRPAVIEYLTPSGRYEACRRSVLARSCA